MGTLNVKINDWLHYIGVNDRETHLFENMWPLDEGVSYNSYLITGEKTALLDTVKITKVDEFVEKMESALDNRPLDYLIVHHMEPDHSGSIDIIRQMYPNVVIVGNQKTKDFLNDFYGITENIQVVKDGESLDLGSQKLTFYFTPMVHWPESMVSFEENSGILFSQDAFGSFGALDGPIFDDEINWDFFEGETRRYYTNIVGKFCRPVQAALKKLGGLDIKMVCPVHGPIWRENPDFIIDYYDKLSSYEVEEGVVIVYGSMYGNTAEVADVMARTLAEEGIKNIKVYDISKTHESYIISDIWKYSGLIMGSCTYYNSVFPPLKSLLYTIEMNKIKNHKLAIYGSYAWSGGGLKYLEEFAERNKIETVGEKLEFKGMAKKEDLEKAREVARELAKEIKG